MEGSQKQPLDGERSFRERVIKPSVLEKTYLGPGQHQKKGTEEKEKEKFCMNPDSKGRAG